MEVIERHPPPGKDVRCDDVGEEPGIVGLAQLAVRKERAERGDDDAALADRPRPQQAAAGIRIMCQRQDDPVGWNAHRQGRKRRLRCERQLLDAREIGVRTVGDQRDVIRLAALAARLHLQPCQVAEVSGHQLTQVSRPVRTVRHCGGHQQRVARP